MTRSTATISRHDETISWRGQFLKDVVHGLSRPQKEISCKYFYDEVGSALFDEICELDEYPSRRGTELAILESTAAEMAEAIGEDCELIEFGSGSGLKTRLLLEQLVGARPICRSTSRDAPQQSAVDLAERFPALQILPVHGDFTQPLLLPDTGDPRVSGSGATIKVATGDVITASSDTIALLAGAAATVTGTGNTITVASGNTLTLSASSTDTINGTGAVINAATGDVLTVSGDTVAFGASATATVTGSGNTINAANGDSLTVSNDTVNLAASAAVTLTGTGNTINVLRAIRSRCRQLNRHDQRLGCDDQRRQRRRYHGVERTPSALARVLPQPSTAAAIRSRSRRAMPSRSGPALPNGQRQRRDDQSCFGQHCTFAASATDTVSGSGATVDIATGDNITASNDIIAFLAGAAATLTGTATRSPSSGNTSRCPQARPIRSTARGQPSTPPLATS